MTPPFPHRSHGERNSGECGGPGMTALALNSILSRLDLPVPAPDPATWTANGRLLSTAEVAIVRGASPTDWQAAHDLAHLDWEEAHPGEPPPWCQS